MRLKSGLRKVRGLALSLAYNVLQKRGVVNDFHALYYDSYKLGKTWADTHWLGVTAKKCPLDLWNYQEIIFETKPDLIIECGTSLGGGALFLASVCDLVGKGRVVSVDLEGRTDRPKHSRITYLLGSSTSEEILNKFKEFIGKGSRVMAILDSDHSKQHVLEELRIYSNLVTKGNYLIVEDTNLNGHPVEPGFGPGPMEALEEFLRENKDFSVDKSREKFYLTFNPNGFLRKMK